MTTKQDRNKTNVQNQKNTEINQQCQFLRHIHLGHTEANWRQSCKGDTSVNCSQQKKSANSIELIFSHKMKRRQRRALAMQGKDNKHNGKLKLTHKSAYQNFGVRVETNRCRKRMTRNMTELSLVGTVEYSDPFSVHFNTWINEHVIISLRHSTSENGPTVLCKRHELFSLHLAKFPVIFDNGSAFGEAVA